MSSLAWLFSTTMMLGNTTAFRGVTKLPPGSCLSYEPNRDLRITEFSPSLTTPMDEPPEAVLPQVLADISDDLNSLKSWNMPITAHLTGGKDSRTVLALALNAGMIHDIESFGTSGDEKNGDVIVARQVAQAAGISHKHYVREDQKSSVSKPSHEQIARKFPYAAFKYEGYLTPYDGAIQPIDELPQELSLMGGGGEIYRAPQSIDSVTNPEDALRLFASWPCHYNPLRILTRRARRYQLKQLQAYAESSVRGGQNAFPYLYVHHRLSNWGCSHFQHNPTPSLSPLVHLSLARLAQTYSGDMIHYGLIKLAAPHLLTIPFCNSEWRGAAAKEAAKHGNLRDPIRVPVEANFPWQFEYYDTHYRELMSIILDNASSLRRWVKPHRLGRLLLQKPEHTTSSHIKIIFALLTVALMHEQCYLRLRDYPASTSSRMGAPPLDLNFSLPTSMPSSAIFDRLQRIGLHQSHI